MLLSHLNIPRKFWRCFINNYFEKKTPVLQSFLNKVASCKLGTLFRMDFDTGIEGNRLNFANRLKILLCEAYFNGASTCCANPSLFNVSFWSLKIPENFWHSDFFRRIESVALF